MSGIPCSSNEEVVKETSSPFPTKEKPASENFRVLPAFSFYNEGSALENIPYLQQRSPMRFTRFLDLWSVAYPFTVFEEKQT